MCLNRSLRKPAASFVRDELSALAPLRMRQATSADVSVISPDSRALPKLLGFNFCRALSIEFKSIPTAPVLVVSGLLLARESLDGFEVLAAVAFFESVVGGGGCEDGGGGGGGGGDMGGGGGGDVGGGGCEGGGAGGGGRSFKASAITCMLLGTGGTGGGIESVFFGLLTLVPSVDLV